MLNPLPKQADLVIVGGGIQGAGVARDAAMRGVRTVLLEKDDFAQGTSSNSSKLIHGGLRYLERGEFHLVYEALKERATLLRIAPHLVQPLSFVIPLYQTGRRASWLYQLGLSLYDFLAEPSPKLPGHQNLDLLTMQEEFLPLRQEGLKSGLHYFDCQMDDTRLVLANIQDACRLGAHCVNHTRVTNVTSSDGLHRVEYQNTQGRGEISAKYLVNATGPWVDQLPESGQKIQRIQQAKGVHLVVQSSWRPKAALMLEAVGESRIFFVIPWGEQLLVGTTDTQYQGPLEPITVTADDLNYLWKNLLHYFPHAREQGWRVVATYAGVRPLTDERGKSTQALSRGYRIVESSKNRFTILGGKYTVYRKIAAKLMNRIAPHLAAASDQRPLPGGDLGDWPLFVESWRPELIGSGLSLAQANLWLNRYGTQIDQLLELQRKWQDPLKAEVHFAVQREYATTLEDFMMRRTRYYYAEDGGKNFAAKVVAQMQELRPELSDALAAELEPYLAKIAARQQLLQGIK